MVTWLALPHDQREVEVTAYNRQNFVLLVEVDFEGASCHHRVILRPWKVTEHHLTQKAPAETLGLFLEALADASLSLLFLLRCIARYRLVLFLISLVREKENDGRCNLGTYQIDTWPNFIT